MTKKMDFGGVGAPVTNSDFGTMGFSLNPLDWFSSSSKTFTPAQELVAGQNWIQSLYNDLKPSATYAQFVDALKLDAAYTSTISDEDYQDFLRDVGFSYLTNSSIADKVKASLLKSFSSNKNMLPSRKSIASAFINPTNVKWTYWDATKLVAKDTAKTVNSVVQTTASVVSNTVSGGAKIISFVAGNLPLVLGVAAIGVGYLAYKNRGLIGERINEKALKAVGLGK